VRIYNLFHRKKTHEMREMPCLYSNIPLKIKCYRKLTPELIRREERFYYGSVVYVSEASLLADSKMYKDDELNEFLMLFNKLFGHETLGGLLMYDTQALEDCHHAIKRCISEYVHLDGKRRFLGLLLSYRRMKLCTSSDSIDVNVFDGKEEDRPSVWIPWFVWKIFDAYCYSILTDDLPVSDVQETVVNLKSPDILTFNRNRFARERARFLKRQQDNADSEVSNDVKKIFGR
jgi:hypothetical protein